MKYVCSLCGWEYDESAGYPEGGIAPGTPWSEVPEDFECPLCGVGKDSFEEAELSAKGVKTMSYENWKDRIGTFEVMDVRGKKLDFFPALKAKAAALKNGEGLHIIQTFEPVPLYPVLALMGFEHHTEKVSGSEYHIWFYRVRKGE